MKLTALFLLAFCLNVSAHGFAQKISLSAKEASLENVFKEIKKQTGYTFVYREVLLQKAKKVTINFNSASLEQVLDVCMKDQPFTYTILNKMVIIKEKEAILQKENYKKPVADTLIKVQGKVTSKGVPVAGASVLMEGTSKGATTDENGNFVLNNVSSGEHTLLITHVGYATLKQKFVAAAESVSLNLEMPSDPLELQQVIMTSTGSPKRKIESSVAITTVSAKTLEDRAPLNSADAIKAIPGVFAVSSGGDGPGNVRVRGLPTAGGYLVFGVMEDGLPVLPTGFNSFPSPDQNFKTDLTIKTIEAIRGGNAPLVMVNTAGALMNNISYTGADKTYGKFKFVTGLSQEMFRVDGNVGGSISKKVKFNVGGFYRKDNGIRPPTYTANKGGQLKANFTWNFNSKGYIRVYTKYINDKVQWQLAGIYPYNTKHRAEAFSTFDVYKETLVPSETSYDIKLPEGNNYAIDLEDGYRTKLGSGGLLFNYTVAGWNIKNNFRYQYNDILGNFSLTAGATPFATNRNYYYTNGQQLMNPAGYYVTQQLNSNKRLEAQIIDYLDLTKKVGHHSLTLGGGIHSYNVISHEAIAAIITTEFKNQPRTILVGSPSATVATASSNGSPGGHIKYDGITKMSSVYAMDELALSDKWRLEAGIRVDHFDLEGTKATYSGSSTASGGTGFKIAGMTPWSNKETYWSASAAANYKVNNSLAFFLRGTRSYNAFNIADFVAIDFNPANLKKREILMGELGSKYAQGRFSLFSSLAYTVGKNLPQLVTVPAAVGGFINQSTFSSSRSIGWETEATYQLLKGLNLRLTSTIQNPVFTDYTFKVDANARPDIAGKTLNWKGNRPQSTPNMNLQFGGTYDYKIFSVFANAMYQSKFYSTSADTYELPAFTEVTAGVGAKLFHKKVELRSWANNLLDTRALTEGNVRGEQFLDKSTLVIGQPMLGRPILPRSFWLSVSYGF